MSEINEAKRTSGDEIGDLAFDMWKEVCWMQAVWFEPVEHAEMAPSSLARQRHHLKRSQPYRKDMSLQTFEDDHFGRVSSKHSTRKVSEIPEKIRRKAGLILWIGCCRLSHDGD